MIDDYLITFDLDWLSEPIIKYVTDILIENQIKSTWYITHDSPEVQKLLTNQDMFEVGLHPNFESGTHLYHKMDRIWYPSESSVCCT